MIYVTRQVKFSAAHRLYNPEYTEEQNESTFDKCNNYWGHGHNYTLEVTVAGEPNIETGYVIDLKKLKRILVENIIDKVDHKHLNHDVDFLDGIIPTVENMAVLFWKILDDKISEGKLYKIKIYETDTSFVEYYGDKTDIKVFL